MSNIVDTFFKNNKHFLDHAVNEAKTNFVTDFKPMDILCEYENKKEKAYYRELKKTYVDKIESYFKTVIKQLRMWEKK